MPFHHLLGIFFVLHCFLITDFIYLLTVIFKKILQNIKNNLYYSLTYMQSTS